MAESNTVARTSAPAGSKGKPVRYDLITPIGMRRLAETAAEGAEKYGERKWENGLDTTDCLSRAIAHLVAYCGGDRSEDHLAHASWNAFAVMHFEENPPTEAQAIAGDEQGTERLLFEDPHRCPSCESSIIALDGSRVWCTQCAFHGPIGANDAVAIGLWATLPRGPLPAVRCPPSTIKRSCPNCGHDGVGVFTHGKDNYLAVECVCGVTGAAATDFDAAVELWNALSRRAE